MKLKYLPLALIAVALAMPPTAAATMKSPDFVNETTAIKATQYDITGFTLTLTAGSGDLFVVDLSDTRAINAPSRLTAPMVVPDQEVSPVGGSSFELNVPNRLHMRKTNQATAIYARSTMLTRPRTTNHDAAMTLVDYGIVNQR